MRICRKFTGLADKDAIWKNPESYRIFLQTHATAGLLKELSRAQGYLTNPQQESFGTNVNETVSEVGTNFRFTTS